MSTNSLGLFRFPGIEQNYSTMSYENVIRTVVIHFFVVRLINSSCLPLSIRWDGKVLISSCGHVS